MNDGERIFYTVSEAAALLRVDSATIYRAIRENAFPALRLRSRYVVPVAAIAAMIEKASSTGTCVDVLAMARERRMEHDFRRLSSG